MVTDAEWRYMVGIFPALKRTPHGRVLLETGMPDSGYSYERRKDARRALRELVNRTYPGHPYGRIAPRLRSEPRRDPFFELTWHRAVRIKPDLEDNLSFTWTPHRNRELLYKAFYAPKDAISPREREDARDEWKRRSGEDLEEENWWESSDTDEVEPEFE